MRPSIMVLAVVLLVAPAIASELGPVRPDRPVTIHTPQPPDPQVIRQGGDTIADAVTIPTYHHQTTGTTVGYTDDYEESCPYVSTSPDVVYRLVPDLDVHVTIDMCGSDYDTKIYVYDQDLELVACNDDFYGFGHPCGAYVSRLDAVLLQGGAVSYLVIDGYGGDAGTYELEIYEMHGEVVECAYGSQLEGEPELADEYVDEHNGGCNTPDAPGGPPFQPIASEWFCGQAGWYMVGDDLYRDTDWFTLTMPSTGELVISGDATYASYMFELGPQDCGSVGVIQQVQIGPIAEGTMVIQGEPGSTVWFWVGAAGWDPPGDDVPQEYTYLLHIPQVVRTESQSWTAVKGLFD